MWALGEGYSAFAGEDPDFAAFLEDRLALSLAAIERQELADYGRWDVADGQRVPAWLVIDGADASAEAVLGLTAYLDAPSSQPSLQHRARTATRELAEGIAAMSSGGNRDYPYGAVLPWTHSRSFWHAWASQMPAALAESAHALRSPRLARPAVRDAAVFTPYLLTATGPVNGWFPAPGDLTQVAYGTDSRLQSLLAVGDLTARESFSQLAAMTASWYFGANRADQPMYEPATGVTYDGLAADGTINGNSGAESTIHGLLSMLALDAHPDVAALAQARTTLAKQDGVQVVEAETATVTDGARVVTPESAWTGESAWSGGSYLSLPRRARAVITVPPGPGPRLVQPVVELVDDPAAGTTRWQARRRPLGAVNTGRAGDQGVTEAPGALLPVTLRRELAAGADQVDVSLPGRASSAPSIDALLLRPAVSRLVLTGPGGTSVLLQSAGRRTTTRQVDVSGDGSAEIRSYDSRGRLRVRSDTTSRTVSARVLAGGFTVITR